MITKCITNIIILLSYMSTIQYDILCDIKSWHTATLHVVIINHIIIILLIIVELAAITSIYLTKSYKYLHYSVHHNSQEHLFDTPSKIQ